jgi:hypothetical protein
VRDFLKEHTHLASEQIMCISISMEGEQSSVDDSFADQIAEAIATSELEIGIIYPDGGRVIFLSNRLSLGWIIPQTEPEEVLPPILQKIINSSILLFITKELYEIVIGPFKEATKGPLTKFWERILRIKKENQKSELVFQGSHISLDGMSEEQMRMAFDLALSVMGKARENA